MWTFLCYTRVGGKNEIRDWYESLSHKDRAKVYSILELLKFSEKKHWRPPNAAKQSGKGKVLYEIRFSLKEKQARIVGYFIDEKMQFVITNHFVKKNKSDNHRGFKVGEKRKREIERNEKRTEKYDFSTD